MRRWIDVYGRYADRARSPLPVIRDGKRRRRVTVFVIELYRDKVVRTNSTARRVNICARQCMEVAGNARCEFLTARCMGGCIDARAM